ncbi:hypothetical protein BDV96DRAFT_270616 [Lophiotrema nucula]|uniref:Uncharacterized protein n=1 Tax=Lophiotrema nucula TaxID=690887 RepID=A0A6A5ZNP3_9PLEO|nr:hypothetical protein BDV96DRAFT_270616 [Lophiotrema nucula]
MKQIVPFFAVVAIAAASPLSSPKPLSKALPLEFALLPGNNSLLVLPNGKIPEWLFYASQWMTCMKKPLDCAGACVEDIRCTHHDLFAKHADVFQPKATNLETFPTVTATPAASSVAKASPSVAAGGTPQIAGSSTGNKNARPSWKTPGKAHWSRPTPGEFGAWTGPQLYGPDDGFASYLAARQGPEEPASSFAPSAAPSSAPKTTTVPNTVVKSKKTSCALKGCTKNTECGTNAKCTLGYCACKPDYRSITSSKSALSGRWDFLPELSAVFVDAGVKCGTKCSKAGCKDVATAGVAGCLDNSGEHGQGTKGKGKESNGVSGQIAATGNDTAVVLPKKKGSGVVQKPTADSEGPVLV